MKKKNEKAEDGFDENRGQIRRKKLTQKDWINISRKKNMPEKMLLGYRQIKWSWK